MPWCWRCCCCRRRSEEHTSELQSLITISYAVFCLKKKINNPDNGLTRNLMPHLWMFLLQPLSPSGHEVLLIDGIFFFNDTATTEIYTVMNTLSLHDALPI